MSSLSRWYVVADGGRARILMHTIALRPLDESHWMVEVSGVQNAQLFMNDSQAEAAALRFAETLADAGQNTRLKVYLPDGTLRSQFVAIPA